MLKTEGTASRREPGQQSARKPQLVAVGSPHPQVMLDRVTVDKGMVKILSSCWKLGIKTVMSCQGGTPATVDDDEKGFKIGQPRPMWIMFPSAADLERFFNTVTEPWRLGVGRSISKEYLWYQWRFVARPWPGQPLSTQIQYHLWIPLAHKPMLESILEKAAKDRWAAMACPETARTA